MTPRWRSSAICGISLCFIAVALSENTTSTETTSRSIEDSTLHSSVPNLEECAKWSRFSSDNAAEETLHTHMCNATRSIKVEVEKPASQDDTKAVQAIAEAVLEVLPSSQQNFALIRDGEQLSCLIPVLP